MQIPAKTSISTPVEDFIRGYVHLKITIELKVCGPNLPKGRHRQARPKRGYWILGFKFHFHYSHLFIVPYRKFNQESY